MAEVALRRKLIICSDEIHGDLVFSGHRHVPTASLAPEIAARTVTIMAPSKTFNIPGLAFSFAVIPDRELRRQYKAAALDIVPHLNNFAYVAALAAYTECDGWLADLLAYLEANRDYLARYVAANWPGVGFAPPEATYLAWLDFRAALQDDPHAFFLQRAGVALNEAAPFGPGSAGFTRLNFGCPRAVLEDALGRMTAALGREAALGA
jgi:cystathionine beta-lyase